MTSESTESEVEVDRLRASCRALEAERDALRVEVAAVRAELAAATARAEKAEEDAASFAQPLADLNDGCLALEREKIALQERLSSAVAAIHLALGWPDDDGLERENWSDYAYEMALASGGEREVFRRNVNRIQLALHSVAQAEWKIGQAVQVETVAVRPRPSHG